MSCSQTINIQRYYPYGGSSTLLQYAHTMCTAGHFNDVIIHTNKGRIPANKMVLSWYSKYFEGRFVTESTEQHEDHVVINKLDGAAVKTIIQYIYTGCIDIQNDTVRNLLAAANFLQVEDVKRLCFEYFQSTMTVDNCVEVLHTSKLYGAPLNEIYQFFNTNFDRIIESNKLSNLHKDHRWAQVR